MNDQYLHGVEILEAPAGPRPVRASSVGAVGLVGTALTGPAGPAIVAGRRAGEDSYGSAGTIPAALAAIYDQGIAPWIVVVNALDRATHRTAVAAADFTFTAAGAVQLDHRLVSDVVVYEFSEAEVGAGSDAAAVGVEGADYAVDLATGIVSRIEGGGIAAAATKRVSYKYVDESLVTEAQVAAAAARLPDAESELGLIPRILIAPGWTGRVTRAAAVLPAVGAITGATVTAALLPLADRLRGIVVADGPNTTDAEAIAYRELFDSRRLFIVDPGVKLAGSAGATYDAPASGRTAGVMARNDADPERGFWWSPSNRPVLGIAGTSRPVSFALSDAVSGSNHLNEHEVATIIRQQGYRLWGNRTCSADPKWAFVSVVRTADAINAALLRSHLWAVDRGITATYADDVIESVNAYLRGLLGQGAILGGRCWIDPELNPAQQVVAGQIHFDFDFTPTYPAERVTFRSHITDRYVETIF